MATESDTFLRAEESANELLNRLEQLKDEIEGYARAKGSLEDVRSQLSSLVQILARTAEQSTSVITTLERIGTPEILKEIEKAVVLNEKTMVALAEMKKDFGEALPSSESKIMKVIAETTESVISGSGATQSHMSKQVRALKQQIDSLSEKVADDVTQICRRVEREGKSIKIMIGLAAAVVAFVMYVIKSN